MKSFLIAVGLVLIGSGCSAKPPAVVANATKKSTITGETWQILTPDESCVRGVFSPSGQKVLALCEGAQHSAAQLYELDLEKKKQRRVTWQDGEISSVDWISNDDVVYTSSTDELKEIPFAAKKLAVGETPGDVYRSDIFGEKIQRLTNRSGYDGDLSVHPKTKEVFFVARTPSEHQIMKIGFRKSAVTVIKGGKEERMSPVVLADGILAWIEKHLSEASR
jgi:Tol biopolymer transport system component